MLQIRTTHETMIIPFSSASSWANRKSSQTSLKYFSSNKVSRISFTNSPCSWARVSLAEEKGILEAVEKKFEVRELPDLTGETFSGVGLA